MEIGKLAKHNSGSGSGGLFSEDIITEIFLWLPLNSLVRFKRLSKRWYFLISHKDSNFRFNYLSTLSIRRRNRIVGSDDFHPIMPGFFYQRRLEYQIPKDRVRFLPTTQGQGQGQGRIEIINNIINPFWSLDKSLDKFSQDLDGKILILASSNGFLLCGSRLIYYLVNPVTMERVAIPKIKSITSTSRVLAVYVGFVCIGDYPSLDLVEYTIVVVFWPLWGANLFLTFFSKGDNEWTEYNCSYRTVKPFDCRRKQNVVIVRTAATNSDDQDQGGGGIVVYFVVKLFRAMTTAIAVFDLNKLGKGPGDNLFQVLEVIETPEPNRGNFRSDDCDDYIREFDGVIHYVRISCSTYFEFWVLNTETKDWCLKHRASLKTMMKGYLWTDVRLWNGPWHGVGVRQHNEALILYQIHAFHPMDPNLIFLTLHGRMACYNLQTRTLELVYDFSAQNMLDKYYHFVYQWPCWPPLF